MKRTWIIVWAVVVCIAVSGLVAGIALSQDEGESETAITVEELPEAVAAVYARFAAAGTVSDYVREVEDGTVDYTAIVEICGGAFELELSEDGSVREVEALSDEDEGEDDGDTEDDDESGDDDEDDAEDEDEYGDDDDDNADDEDGEDA